MDALHVLGGVALQLVCALLLRTSLASWRPWLVVAGLETINEAHDFWVEVWPSMGMQVGEAAKDIALTLAVPTLLLVLGRHAPGIFADPRNPMKRS